MHAIRRTTFALCALGWTALLVTPAAPGETIAYVSDLINDSVVRLRDLNGDGDYHDAGEATRFFGPGNADGWLGVGSAQCLLVLGPDDVLAADGEEAGGYQTRVLRLRDLNGDGDAMDPGEATEFWNAMLPIGVNYDRPKDMLLLPDGAILLADNNTINFDNDTPAALWRLEDQSGDGDVNEPNEVSLHLELAPVGQPFGFVFEDFKRDAAGRIWLSNQESSSNDGSVFIIEPDLSVHEFAADVDLVGILLAKIGMTLHPSTGNPVFAAVDIFENRRIVELTDTNGNGVIDSTAELLTRFRTDVAVEPITWDYNTAMDVDFDPHGTLWLLDYANTTILAFRDANSDGDYNDAGEARVAYHSPTADASGSVFIDYPRTIAFACAGGRADFDLDGQVDVSDLGVLLSNFGRTDAIAAEGDANGDGVVDVTDLGTCLGEFGGACP